MKFIGKPGSLPREASVLTPPRPMIRPLRQPETAIVRMEHTGDGRRRITIVHQDLAGVSPAMLAWWYGNVHKDMEYCGERLPRYLVWHPLDHISYTVLHRPRPGPVVPGARLHIREAFQRDPDQLLDVRVEVERLDATAAVIASRVLGLTVLRLVNRFVPTETGTRYTSEMEIGTGNPLSRLGVNRLLRRRILAGDMALAWVRHHIEEISNLETFLPALFAAEAGDNARQPPS